MKTRIFCVFFILLSAVVCSMAVGQEKSDYSTVQQFQENVKSIETSIENAKTAQECSNISAAIARLETTYSGDRELLDKTLYPDDYSKVVEKLRSKLHLRQQDLTTIGNQTVQIAGLEARLQELSDQLTKLNAENERLTEDVKRLSSNIQKLTGDEFDASTPIDSLRALIVQLRQGLHQRDQLIYALADSLFLQYDKNPGELKDVEKQNLSGKLERYGIISTVKRSIQDNLAFLESTQLKGSDLVTIVRQQQQFASQWKGLAPKISSLYAPSSGAKGKAGKIAVNEAARVDSMLTIWSKKVDGAMWHSLNQLFKDHGFVVKDFTNGTEFTANFCSFLDEQTQNIKQDNKETRNKFYHNFEDDVWKGEFGIVWLPALVQMQKITPDQKKEIEDKVAVWQSSVQPGTNWITFILVLEGLVVLAIVLVWILRKKGVPAEPAE